MHSAFFHALWVNAPVVILACYIMGLLCFAIGRLVRVSIPKFRAQEPFDDHFKTVLQAHDLQDKEPYKSYLARADGRGAQRLYTRLWAELRQSDRLALFLSLVRRYWVTAATCDGLIFAIAVWIVVLIALSAGAGVEEAARPR